MATTNKDDLLAQFQTVDTGVITLENPKGGELLFNGEPVTIEVYGPGTKEFIRAKHKLDMNAQARNVAMIQNKGSRHAAEEAAKDAADFLAGVTKSINNFPETEPAKVYGDPRLQYIADQVDRFLGKTENFMPN